MSISEGQVLTKAEASGTLKHRICYLSLTTISASCTIKSAINVCQAHACIQMRRGFVNWSGLNQDGSMSSWRAV